MLKEYLEKQNRILSEKKEELEEELSSLDNKIKETEKFMELIRTENDPPFAEFSPHTVSTRSQEKLKELQLSLDEMNQNRQRINEEKEALELSIMELMTATKEADSISIDQIPSVNETVNPISEAANDPLYTSEPKNKKTNTETSNDSILSDLYKIKNICLSDPYLAEGMINSLINKLEEN